MPELGSKSTNDLIDQRFGMETGIGKTVELNKTLDSILSRRSYRKFKPTKIDEDLMQTLFAAASSAPSKSDLQQTTVIRITDKDQKQRFANLSPDLQPWIADAPEFLVWCGDNSRLQELCKKHGHAYANNHLDQFMNPAVDAGITMDRFMCAAESMGLGCCPVSSIRNTPHELSELLQLPKFVFPVAGLVVGYPDEDVEISMRLPLTVTVMNNRYEAAGVLGRIADYDIRREEAHPTPEAEQRRTDVYDTVDLYSWSEDKTRQYGLLEREEWSAYIQKQGFKTS